MQCRLRAVHPRLCGEHQVRLGFCDISIGSSPPVRGTLKLCVGRRWVQRFIPACAGNTFGSSLPISSQPVHPRLCGEHVPCHAIARALGGSSPPVRGTLFKFGQFPRHTRFIPACAGNTSTRRLVRRKPAVHPRLCGEHNKRGPKRKFHHGSSPPVRGTPLSSPANYLQQRFIPACAGNTSFCSTRAA